jgi:hypothetical protein
MNRLMNKTRGQNLTLLSLLYNLSPPPSCVRSDGCHVQRERDPGQGQQGEETLLIQQAGDQQL